MTERLRLQFTGSESRQSSARLDTIRKRLSLPSAGTAEIGSARISQGFRGIFQCENRTSSILAGSGFLLAPQVGLNSFEQTIHITIEVGIGTDVNAIAKSQWL
jgi:hypothetical protein